MPAIDHLTTIPWASSPWILAPAALVLWIALFLTVKTIVLGALHRVAARTAWAWDDILIDALSTPLLITILGSGFLVFDRILPLEPEWDRGFDVLFAFSISLSLVLFLDRLTRGGLDRLAAGSPALQGARGLIQGSVRGVVIGLGLLIFLDSIGISITPILASLGVGSLAVALALQDTLANLFAGLYMIADKPIEPGHMIRLPGGEEGYVTRVGWRSTWIRMPQNNMLVIPNSKLAGGTIINYDLPQPEVGVSVTVGVHRDSDLVAVERVTLEVAREVQRSVEGAVPGAEPAVRYQEFGESSIQFAVALRARDFAGSHMVKHEFVKRLQVRYRREGIILPYPVRTLDFPSGHAGGRKEAFGGGSVAPAPDRPVGFTTPGTPERRGP
jgi:small-conductance mechanosensitive channel